MPVPTPGLKRIESSAVQSSPRPSTESRSVSGAPLTLRDSVLGRGLDWTADDSILFNPGVGTGIWRVRSGGDTPTAVTKTEPGEDQHRYPAMLPGGRAVLFSAFSGGGIAEDQIYVQLLD